MRYNDFGQIAYNFERRAVAVWKTNATTLEQQPIDMADRDGAWCMVETTNGIPARLPVKNGCNQLAAHNDRWMRRFDGATPKLSGSQAWAPADGYVGDINGEWACSVSADGKTLHAWKDGAEVATYPRVNAFGEVRIKSGILAWTEDPGPVIRAIDLATGEKLTVQQRGPQAYGAIVFEQNGARWVVYQNDAMGGLCHRIDDASKGYRFAIPPQGKAPSIYNQDVWIHDTGEGCTIGWSSDPGEFAQGALVISVLGEAMIPLALPAPVPVPIDNFGQRSGRITDGTVLDLRTFVFGAPSTFPRTGAHGMNQVETAPGVFALVKFQQARAYELWSVGPNYIHHLEDASDGRRTEDLKPGDPPPQTYRFTDTRWMPNVWKVGGSFTLPPHFADFFNRDTGVQLEHRPYDRRMQIVEAWERFDCGPDLGVRRVICVLYDPTGGAHSDQRFVELFYFAEGAGWIGWWPHRSDKVFANGGQKFDSTTQSEPMKGFYRFGSEATRPALTGLANSPTEIPPVSVPDYSQSVRDIAATGGYKLDTKEGDGIFTRACARIMHKVNARIGHLRKNEGQNHVTDLATSERHAVDNILFLDDAPGQSTAIDLVSSSETPEARPSWGPDTPRYSASDWFAPAPITPSQVVRPAMPFTKAVTAFDLLTHMNQAWINLFATDEALVVVPQSVYRRPRTLADGRTQLAQALPTFTAKGRKVIVIVNCDTGEYAKSEGLDAEGIRNNTKAINAILVANASAIAAVVICNENNNSNELPIMGDPAFMKELCGYIDPRFPLATGHFWCAEAGEIAAIGSWLSVHSDRGATPEANGLTMAALGSKFGKKVGDREPKGICEASDPRANTSQRTTDPAEIGRQGAAAVKYGLCLSVLHSSAGVEGQCDPAAFGPNHRAALVEWRKALGGASIPPPPPPPPVVDPILDAPLVPAYPTAYLFWVRNMRMIIAKVESEYQARYGRPIDDGLLAHELWRVFNENERWGTMRKAMEDMK